MAWTSPMTATANSAFTAAQFNTHVRDNLLETGPAKATAAGRILVTTGANAIAERTIGSDYIETSQTTSSSSFDNLATVGPSVTVTTGTKALVFWTAQAGHSSANTVVQMAVAVSGATTINPTGGDGTDLYYDGLGASQQLRCGQFHFFDGTLTAGSNTFTMKYRVPSGAASGSFGERRLVVMAL